MIHENYIIQGQFSFSVFNKDGSLSRSARLPNFITPTGLSYINEFGFADCCRYLSLGSGTGLNTILGLGTTGLSGKINKTGFNYIGGNREGVCSQNESNHYTSGCGYVSTESGVKLFRSWRVPVSTNDFFTEPYIFKEYMLSPSLPEIEGWASNGSGYVMSGACSCNRSVLSGSGSGGSLYGNEAHDFWLANTGICKASKAFTRIIKNVSVDIDQYMIVNYELNVGIDTGVQRFQITPTLTSPYSGLSGEGYNNWKYVSGKHAIIHPGIKLINDGSVVSVARADQINSSYVFRYGESYIPSLGIPMEPSCPLVYRFGYISNDNLFAIVNGTGFLNDDPQVIDTGLYKPFNSTGREFPNGLISYHSSSLNEIDTYVLKPRSEASTFSYYADPFNYRDGNNGQFIVFFGEGHPFYPKTLETVTNGVSDSFDSFVLSGRSRSKTLSFQFVDHSLTERIPVRAMVIGYKPTLNTDNAPYNYFPAIDVVFAAIDTGLNFVNDPLVDTGNFTYAKPRDLLTNESLGISGGYNYMDENNILQLQFKLNWSSPCPSGVIGC